MLDLESNDNQRDADAGARDGNAPTLPPTEPLFTRASSFAQYPPRISVINARGRLVPVL